MFTFKYDYCFKNVLLNYPTLVLILIVNHSRILDLKLFYLNCEHIFWHCNDMGIGYL